MKERVAKWDNLKFVLIFLVVLGHFIDYYETGLPWLQTIFLWIYSFHIPAFLFVSGLMSKKTVNTTPFRTVRVMSLWALYLLCNGLMLLCKAIAQKPLDLHLFGQDHYSWFLFVLPVFYLLTRAMRSLPAPFAIGFWVVVGCLAGYDQSIGDMWYLSRTLVFYPFFLIGYYWDGQAILRVLDRVWVRVLSGVFLIGTFVWMYLKIEKWYEVRPFFTGRNAFEKAGEPIKDAAGRDKLKYICGKLGIPYRSPHKIRKTYGTMLIDSNIPAKIVQQQMEHEDISTTMKHYYRDINNLDTKRRVIDEIEPFKKWHNNKRPISNDYH